MSSQGCTACSLSSLANFLKKISLKSVFCVFRDIGTKISNQGFWNKTAVFSLPATKMHCLLIFWLQSSFLSLSPPSSVLILYILKPKNLQKSSLAANLITTTFATLCLRLKIFPYMPFLSTVSSPLLCRLWQLAHSRPQGSRHQSSPGIWHFDIVSKIFATVGMHEIYSHY